MPKEQIKVNVKRIISLTGPTLLEKLIEYIKEQEVKEFDSNDNKKQSP